MADLRVTVGDIELEADWTDDHPAIREAVEAALPVEGDATRWGDELYFRIPVDVEPDGGQTEVPVGGIAYWPPGSALCVFWGPTPASHGDEPRAASDVSLIAMLADPTELSQLEGGAVVRIEPA